jgi:hypothetical protein
MKPARIPQTVTAPSTWASCPGANTIAKRWKGLKPWLAKMYGFHLLKIGNLSAEINTEAALFRIR